MKQQNGFIDPAAIVVGVIVIVGAATLFLGGPIYNEAPNNNHYRSATKTVVFPVTIGDEVTLVVERDGEFAFRAENAEACLHEVR